MLDTSAEISDKLRIIPRAEHAISRRNISKAALRVLYKLQEAGYSAYLVGGAVRDLLLEGKPKDFDVATNATPGEVKQLFRNCRLIGRRFRLAHVIFGPEVIEVATFRGTGEEEDGGDRHIVDGRIVRDNVWGSIEEDARRRDFRMNALYYDISDFSVRDYVGGIQDIARREVRLIGDPVIRYQEDPVRMLRAVRLAAKLDFHIDTAAAAPFAELGELLGEVAPARLFDETLKLFLAGHGLKSFQRLEQGDLFRFLFPATAQRLEGLDGGGLHRMLEQSLRNTDARVAEGKSVTPAFLFAVILWGPVQGLAQVHMAHGALPLNAWIQAAAQVLAEQSLRIAIPRRFSQMIEDIWLLQPRFTQFHCSKVLDWLTHPRFRAAFDFLQLRACAEPSLVSLGAWWEQAQQLPPELLRTALEEYARANGLSDTEPEDWVALPRPAPSRRRRSRSRGATTSHSA